MANYYFLAASLPSLTIGEKPEITFDELSSRLKINLSKKDFEKVVVLRRYVDIENVRYLLLDQPIEDRGNFSELELDEALLTFSGLPEYFFDFFAKYTTTEERLRYFPEVFSSYFLEEAAKQKGFVHTYLTFERGVRLVLLALRAKALRKDVFQELQFEDFTEPFIAQILAQKDMEMYEPPMEFTELKEIFTFTSHDPWERHRRIAEYRFTKIQEMVSKPLFSIEWILAYMLRLRIVEMWNEMSAEKGKEIVTSLAKI